ncbi:MAG TPA: VCBS repeat-containing protein [Verrucomicrobiae bacterium]|nr:VCBS repeat-containing protein [Verrucomicrobiae bacterium]
MTFRRAFLVLVVIPRLLHAGDWQTGSGFRWFEPNVGTESKDGFKMVGSGLSGITFTNVLPEQRHLTNQILLNGSGVAAGDIDGDGLCDVYFCGLDSTNRLYRNKGGWKFEDITGFAGVGCATLTSTGAALADLDGDNDLDLIVSSIGGGTHLFFNDGKGKFRQAEAVLNAGKAGMSMALGDIDGDGFLDLYIANYRTSGLMDMPNARATFKRVDGKTVVETVNGRPVTEPDLIDRFIVGPRGDIIEQGEADVLYRNPGGNGFTPVPFTGGAFLDEDNRPLTKPPLDWGLSVMFRDVNGDSLPDIYVCNDFQAADRFWMNQGAGKFRLLPRLAQRKASLFSMAVDFADINRDGFEDFLVLDMLSRDHRQRMMDVPDSTPPLYVVGETDNRPQYGLNTLFLNRGDSTFAEIAQLSGLDASEWSWACIFVDVDLDGWEDVLISNGMERAARDRDVAQRLKEMRARRPMSDKEIFQARKMFPRLATANLAFRNRGDLTFEDVSAAWGFDARGVSHGMVLADLDNDGDLDVVVNNLNGEAGVYQNEGTEPRVGVRLKGVAPNTRGIGAKVWVYGGAAPVQSQEMICGGRYLSSDDAMRVFAAGGRTNEMRIEVRWRNGKRSVVNGVKANRIYEIDEAGSTEIQSPKSEIQSAEPLFEDVSALLGHTHHEEEFNDYVRQPLLPRKLSQLGPGVGWYDMDGDGWEDLVIGSGKGGKLGAYRNDGQGGFKRMTNGVLERVVTRDQSGVVGVGPGKVLVGSANYEDGLAVGGSVKEYDLAKGTMEDRVAGGEGSVGPLALGDVDGDGDLDLFVGGRVIPGRYPEAASSRLFRNEAGKLVADTQNATALEKAGLASGAVFSDLDGDGKPELIVACEWGPVRVFKNEHGKLVPWDVPVTLNHQPSTLNQLTGWWNGVNAGDFDGDGRLDLVASNWGRNTSYESEQSRPLKLYHGDLDGDGSVDLVEARHDEAMKKEVPERGLEVMGRAMPFLREKFATHRAYAVAGVSEILGDRLSRAKTAQVNCRESMVFLNRGDHFEARALPAEAQFAPGFSVCVGDCDGDGHEDIFLSQNFFGINPETARCDGGRGLWLRGDGKGNLAAMPGQHSGIKVYGEQRGAALCDYDGDGRVDLVASQNGTETKLYRNTGARPGLRVRLKGPAGNPTGVGAMVRLKFQDSFGPAREIHAGSGYWSQDSAVLVMATAEPFIQIHVLWPGGKRTVSTLPASAWEIVLNPAGDLQVTK